ncbi:long-chain fatty acid--CoA ligase [Anopheles sinensis]|uniref:Long-chain fatty acid--CoA ligase n=1 Tax=Anopheles sinensis TaxID=74873 RepID=A0A084WIM6_ANOSI|nr:long-chain fatty acid--CoA ligase [Anopheles sinensis]
MYSLSESNYIFDPFDTSGSVFVDDHDDDDVFFYSPLGISRCASSASATSLSPGTRSRFGPRRCSHIHLILLRLRDVCKLPVFGSETLITADDDDDRIVDMLGFGRRSEEGEGEPW